MDALSIVHDEDGSSEPSMMMGVLQMKELPVMIDRSLGMHSVKLSSGLLGLPALSRCLFFNS